MRRIAQRLGAGRGFQHQRLRALVHPRADAPQIAVHRQAGIGPRLVGQGQDQRVHPLAPGLQGDAGGGQGAVLFGQPVQQAFGLFPLAAVQHPRDPRGDQGGQRIGMGCQQCGLVGGIQRRLGEKACAFGPGVGGGQGGDQRLMGAQGGGLAVGEPDRGLVRGQRAQLAVAALPDLVKAGPVGIAGHEIQEIGEVAMARAQGLPADQRLGQGACALRGGARGRPVAGIGGGQRQRHRAGFLGPHGGGQRQGRQHRGQHHVTQKSHHHPVSRPKPADAIHILGKCRAPR